MVPAPRNPILAMNATALQFVETAMIEEMGTHTIS
jgi:hypothetical protein